ncbi:hypothetical protein QR680_000778 [Steinernema hermaphroditum]|uniref:legumain n=1 Tax=Steinernema hermaphroditum TaxID=289476 RepID=A0AA39GXU7_9BILA|nr:hypothetical protein QR680_000778 [Steinernema hermaphroditum]
MNTLVHVLALFAVLLWNTIWATSADREPKKWALLIAGSNGFDNYRHQADVCHAYQILRKHGIPEDNIVTLMYDDIAHNSYNPYPGKIFNSPKKDDVYAGVKIDYKGDDVNAQVFIDVLTGNKSGVAHAGNGRVIESDHNDHVFIYYTDHGATGIIGMPAGDPLTKADLWNGLDYMYNNKRYGKLVFYLEACESGSMFEGFPANREVYVMTASNPDESSWAVYCDQSDLPCLGDEFSVNWMEDSENNNVNAETLKKQYSDTKKATKQSHVSKYGDFDFLTEAVGDFQGERCEKARTSSFVESEHAWAVQDIPIRELEKRIQFATSSEIREGLRLQLQEIKEKREKVANLYFSIAKKVIGCAPEILSDVVSVRPKTLTQLKCHNEVVHTFDKECLLFSKNPFVFHHAFILANLCELLKSSDRIVAAITEECAGINLTNVV